MTAVMSPDGVYRYRLERSVNMLAKGTVCFVMLNPSMADAERDDPTIRRCERFAYDWGMGRLVVVNLYALRSTDPKALRRHDNPVGPANEYHVLEAAKEADLLVCAWGNHGGEVGRNLRGWLWERGFNPYVLALTKAGQPQHPLYIAANKRPIPWVAS